MRTFIDITFSSDGTVPSVVADRLRDLAGVSIVVGHHDVVLDWSDVEEFRVKVKAIHDALVGTHATDRVETGEDEGASGTLAWPPSPASEPSENPGSRSRRPGGAPPPGD